MLADLLRRLAEDPALTREERSVLRNHIRDLEHAARERRAQDDTRETAVEPKP